MSITAPRPFDNFLTEKWLIGPHLDLEHRRLVGPQTHFQLRSRAAGQRSEQRRIRRPDTRIVQTDNGRLSKRSPADFVAHDHDGFFFSRVGCGTGAAVCSSSVRNSSAIIPKQTAGFLEATAKIDNLILSPARDTISVQSIRRHLDVSFRRQLQDRQDGHDAAFERRDRIQSAEQPGQNFSATTRDPLRPEEDLRLGRGR